MAETSHAIATRDLTLSIAGQARLDGLNLDLSPSGITVIMGPNGAGKSLLLRMLHGLIAPSSGTIDAGDGAQQAMVFQRPVMLRRSVAANLMFALRRAQRLLPSADQNGNVQLPRVSSSEDRCKAILEDIGLADRASQPARALSGGEQQRLALARALALEPETLFLDEPTASLDPAATLAIEKIVLRAAHNGTKIVLVTHDIGQSKRLADDIVFLHNGRLCEHSSAAEFFQNPSSEQARAYLTGQIVL